MAVAEQSRARPRSLFCIVSWRAGRVRQEGCLAASGSARVGSQSHHYSGQSHRGGSQSADVVLIQGSPRALTGCRQPQTLAGRLCGHAAAPACHSRMHESNTHWANVSARKGPVARTLMALRRTPRDSRADRAPGRQKPAVAAQAYTQVPKQLCAGHPAHVSWQ